jgi:hypothetical protein
MLALSTSIRMELVGKCRDQERHPDQNFKTGALNRSATHPTNQLKSLDIPDEQNGPEGPLLPGAAGNWPAGPL